MRVVIIGGVAAGTAAAAKLSRSMKKEDVEIVIYEELNFISYSSCNMPYYIGDLFEDAESIIPRDPSYFKEHYNTDVFTRHRVEKVNPENKEVTVKNLDTGEVFVDRYDKLLFSTGARSAFPPIKGLDRKNVYALRVVEDMFHIKSRLDCCQEPGSTAIVIGSGFIGLEMVENFANLGYKIKLLVMDQVSNLSPEMSVYLETYLEKKGVEIVRDALAVEIDDQGVQLKDGRHIKGDFVLVATGARPNTEIAEDIGIALGSSKAIITDSRMQTNIKDIYAAGDCAETVSVIDGSPVYRPLGSTANKMGRVVADHIAGLPARFPGIAGTSIFKLFHMEIGSTGFSENEAIRLGYDVMVFYHVSRSHYLTHGGEPILVKAVADRTTLRLLGVEIIGFTGVLPRLDVYATLLHYKATLDQLEFLDLAYAPPFATVRDVVLYTGMIGMNVYEKGPRELTDEDRFQKDFLEYIQRRAE